MQLQRLEIDSYKSIIKPLVLNFSSTINILIGQNNCGKTNIIDAIDTVFHPDKDPARLHHHRADIRLYLKDQGQPLSFKQGKVESTDPKLAQSVMRLDDNSYNDFSQIDQDYRTLYQWYPGSFAKMQELLAEYFPELTLADKALDQDAETGLPVFKENNKAILIDRLGSGFRKIFVILLYALHPNYPVLLLDEPEAHLHPALIKKLTSVLSSRVTNQIVLTTHSTLFIRPDNLHNLIRVVRDGQLGTHYFSLNTHGDQIDRQRLIQELNADNLEMFFADKVLLVEGVSDRLLMRGLMDRFYHGPLEIKAIEMHGKTNVDVYIDLLQAFNIPFLVMLDKDALGWWSDEYLRQHGVYLGRRNRGQAIDSLRQLHIYILPNGTVEQNYPRRYQRDKKKPLNALRAARQISQAEFDSQEMKYLKQVITALAYES